MNTDFSYTSIAEIERQARAMQAQVVADAFRALRRMIVARVQRAGSEHTA